LATEADHLDVHDVCERAWADLSPLYRLDDLTDEQVEIWRRCLDRDVWLTVEVLAGLGVVTMDLTVDRTERRNQPVGLTDLGRWATRTAQGGVVAGAPVLCLRVELVDSADPVVWRRVVVPADCTLARLHDVIQAAMGWTNSHLHLFDVRGRRYGMPGADLGLRAEEGVRLCDVAQVGDVLGYDYDFGDGWEHQITVERVDVARPDVRYPCCVDGEGACPPEDCGGIPGYEDLRRIMKDPSDPEHESMLDWLGLDSAVSFEPAEFDVHEAQLRLAARMTAGRRRETRR
jgi:hypothetical protein